MSTATDMINRLADEFDDTDLATGGQFLKAINSAVQEHRDKRFWFNTVVAKAFPVAATTEYLLPAFTVPVTGISATEPYTVIDLLQIDDGAGANYRPLELVSNDLINNRQTGSVTGRPRYYSLVSDSDGTRLRFFPYADIAYTGVLSGLIRFSDFTGSESNPWVNDAETLIRQTAKRIIMSDVTKELPPGSGPTAAERRALSDLMKSSRLRMGNTLLRADELVALQGRSRYDITSDTYR